LNIYICREDLQ